MLCSCQYDDESYDISGSLLLYCEKFVIAQNNNVLIGDGGSYCMEQLLNYNELLPLCDALQYCYKNNNINNIAYSNDMVPGSSIKSFNKIVEIYKYLFDNGMIDELIESKYFNFAWLNKTNMI